RQQVARVGWLHLSLQRILHVYNATFVGKIWVLVKNICVEYLPNNYNVSHLSYKYTLTHPNSNIQEVGLGHHWDDEETHAGMRAPLSSTFHMVHQRELLVQSVATTVVAGM
ncbi:hypothetical protein ACJX0J_019171, partial [Zea mays]